MDEHTEIYAEISNNYAAMKDESIHTKENEYDYNEDDYEVMTTITT